MHTPTPLTHTHHAARGGCLFSPTGTHFLVRTPLSTLLCECPSARTVTEIVGANQFAYAFSPDGRAFVHAYEAHAIPVHDAATGALITTLTTSRDNEDLAQCAAFHPDGERILVGTSDGSVRVWNRTTGKADKPMRRGNNAVSAIHVLRDARRALFVTSFAKAMRVWDIERSKALFAFEHPAPVRTVSVDASLQRVVTSTKSGLFVWDLETGEQIATITDARVRDCNGHAVLERGALVATARDHAIHLWDTRDGAHVVSLPMRADGEIAVDRLDDQHLFVLCNGRDDDQPAIASVWNVSERREVARLDHPRAIHATDVSRDGVLALVDARGDLCLFDLGMKFAPPTFDHAAHEANAPHIDPSGIDLDAIRTTGRKRVIPATEFNEATRAFGRVFPADWRPFLERFGTGEYCDVLRVHSPRAVVDDSLKAKNTGVFTLDAWTHARDRFSAEDLGSVVVLARSIDGDYLTLIATKPGALYVFPRQLGEIDEVGPTFAHGLAWFSHSGRAYDPTTKLTYAR